jgi:hypothetical protein
MNYTREGKKLRKNKKDGRNRETKTAEAILGVDVRFTNRGL